MINYPCQGCEDRKVGCHDMCAKYKSVCAQNMEIRRIRDVTQFTERIGIKESQRRSKTSRITSKVIKCHKK